MKMITAIAAVASLALSSVAFAGGPTAVKKEDDPTPPAVVPSSGPESLAGVGSLGAGGAAALAGLAALALVAALANSNDGGTSTTTTGP